MVVHCTPWGLKAMAAFPAVDAVNADRHDQFIAHACKVIAENLPWLPALLNQQNATVMCGQLVYAYALPGIGAWTPVPEAARLLALLPWTEGEQSH